MKMNQMNIFGINAIQIENESDKSKYYGKNVIGYTPQNGSTVGWKIFYIEIQQLNKSYFDQGFTSKNGDINVMYVYYDGFVDSGSYLWEDLGFRPVVCLNSYVELQKKDNGFCIKEQFKKPLIMRFFKTYTGFLSRSFDTLLFLY